MNKNRENSLNMSLLSEKIDQIEAVIDRLKIENNAFKKNLLKAKSKIDEAMQKIENEKKQKINIFNLKIVPFDNEEDKIVAMYLIQAEEYIENNNKRKAEDCFINAVEINDRNPYIYRNQAVFESKREGLTPIFGQIF